MSPSRSRRPAYRHRSRREVWTAVGGALAVVVFTVLMIWLLRPGPPGTEGTGGLASRQPRAAWLVALTILALVGFVWWAVRRQRDWRGKLIIVLPAGVVIILLLAALGGILWPGGLLRQTTPPPPPIDPGDLTSTTLPPELTSTTLAPDPSATTVPPAP